MSRPALTDDEKDIGFLVRRLDILRGHYGTRGDLPREHGISSDAIVHFAYTGERPDRWPFDSEDYAACERAVASIPDHRRTPEVMALLDEARTHVQAWHPTNGGEMRLEKR